MKGKRKGRTRIRPPQPHWRLYRAFAMWLDGWTTETAEEGSEIADDDVESIFPARLFVVVASTDGKNHQLLELV
jgi:hypothetical protein